MTTAPCLCPPCRCGEDQVSRCCTNIKEYGPNRVPDTSSLFISSTRKTLCPAAGVRHPPPHPSCSFGHFFQSHAWPAWRLVHRMRRARLCILGLACSLATSNALAIRPGFKCGIHCDMSCLCLKEHLHLPDCAVRTQQRTCTHPNTLLTLFSQLRPVAQLACWKGCPAGRTTRSLQGTLASAPSGFAKIMLALLLRQAVQLNPVGRQILSLYLSLRSLRWGAYFSASVRAHASESERDRRGRRGGTM